MKNKLLTSLLAVLAIILLAMPALAGVTFVTRGQAKLGGIVLNGTTLTSTGAEINLLAGAAASLVQSSTPATGSCAVQLAFHNAAGVAPTGPRSLIGYVSDASGNQAAAVTSLVTLTNGAVTQLVAGKVILGTTTSAGLLGVTLTAATGTYYLSFDLPGGKTITTPAITVN